jgi:hypothetical protein
MLGDDTTNIQQGPSSCDGPRGWMRPKLESRSDVGLSKLYQSHKHVVSMRRFSRL